MPIYKNVLIYPRKKTNTNSSIKIQKYFCSTLKKLVRKPNDFSRSKISARTKIKIILCNLSKEKTENNSEKLTLFDRRRQ